MQKKILFGTAAAVIAAAIGLSAWHLGWLDRWENAAWDLRVRYFASPSENTQKIKLVLLDQPSLDWGANAQGWPWPWPRQAYGWIAGFCRHGGARAVAIDVIFTEVSASDVYDDEAFGAEIADAGNVAVALSLEKGQGRGVEEWPEGIPYPELAVSGLDEWVKETGRQNLLTAAATFPVPEIGRNAAVLGDIGGKLDVDAVIRRTSLFRVFDHRPVPSLGFAAYLAAFPAREFHLKGDSFYWRDGARSIPLDREGRVLLSYRGGTGVYDAVSAASVLESLRLLQEGKKPLLSPEFFRDSIVLFGFSAPGLLDLRPTPLNPVSPGVEVHATLLDNLMSGDAMRDVPPGTVLAVVIMLSLLGALSITAGGGVKKAVGVFVLLLPLPVLLAFLAYGQGFWFPMVVAEFSLVLAMLSGVIINYATEGRQKVFYRKAFQHYLSPAVIDRLLDDPSMLRLGGERRELTIFFSDLQGFSSISERLDAEELTSLLNDYLTDMTNIILEEGGTLDKYEGDAIIAFWNAPLPMEDHAVRACRAALRCQRRLESRRNEFRQRTGESLFQRIGINTGPVVVGNMGSEKRFDYTVLGDAANLASRLEGANKVFGTYLMVSEDTWNMTGNHFTGREMGLIQVVGRKAPVKVFEITGIGEEPEPGFIGDYNKALSAFKEGRIDESRTLFERCGEDPVSRAYLRRISDAVSSGDAGWDPVWNLTSK